MGGYEILEHTADVGLRAHGATLEECFEQAAAALVEIIGIARPGEGRRHSIELVADDVGALLVDWLSEIVYLHDVNDAVISKIEVTKVTDGELRGGVAMAPRGDADIEGIQVKAVTYHQLDVQRSARGWKAEVYLDV
jgi:SHS2 domain-containing protein